MVNSLGSNDKFSNKSLTYIQSNSGSKVEPEQDCLDFCPLGSLTI